MKFKLYYLIKWNTKEAINRTRKITNSTLAISIEINFTSVKPKKPEMIAKIKNRMTKPRIDIFSPLIKYFFIYLQFKSNLSIIKI